MIDNADGNLVYFLRAFARGPSQAVSAKELAMELQTNERTVRAKISHLRSDCHEPICGVPQTGYFWPRNHADTDHTIASLPSRIKAIEDVRDGLIVATRKELGNPMLFEEVG